MMGNKANLSVPWNLLIALTLITALAVTGATKPSFDIASKMGARFESPLFYSPLPTPTPTSSPRPSQFAQRALLHIAKREGIPLEVLQVVDDHPTEYPNLGRQFQVVTILDNRPKGQVYKLLVDLRSGRVEEDISALLAEEARAHESRYGKLQPALYERLQSLNDDETLPVAIWVAAGPGQSLAEQQAAAFATLAARYPEVRAALERFGKPMDVNDPALRQRIEAEYIELLNAQTEVRSRPLITELTHGGFTVTTYPGMPSFTAVLPKRVILELARRPDVSAIYLVETEEQPALDSAVPTSLAPFVWARGYDGSGVTVAILEHGNVDPSNSFLHLSPVRRDADNGVQDHTTRVASAAASFHDIYRGVAPGATILSAGENGQQADVVAALQWAFNQGTWIVNYSAGFEEDNNVNWIDRTFDYWARQRFRTIVVAAGNSGGSLTSPGKAWNVITVGAIDDGNNADWSDDQMWPSSAYVNPVSPHNDREKPEVVAVGVNVTALGVNNVPQTRPGTSHAAPQVAGLVALLLHRNGALGAWPEAAKAIIMASATHNIIGPTIIVRGQGDLRDGAGAINAALADTVAQVRADASTTCQVPCWWGDYIDNSNFPVGSEWERNFYARKGDLVRIAIAWWAHADTPSNNYSFDRLDTDLDLRIKGPNGQYVPNVYSVSWDNNYEMVEFVAPQTGNYRIAVHKVRADEISNFLGIAFVRLPRVYIPLVLKNYS